MKKHLFSVALAALALHAAGASPEFEAAMKAVENWDYTAPGAPEEYARLVVRAWKPVLADPDCARAKNAADTAWRAYLAGLERAAGDAGAPVRRYAELNDKLLCAAYSQFALTPENRRELNEFNTLDQELTKKYRTPELQNLRFEWQLANLELRARENYAKAASDQPEIVEYRQVRKVFNKRRSGAKLAEFTRYMAPGEGSTSRDFRCAIEVTEELRTNRDPHDQAQLSRVQEADSLMRWRLNMAPEVSGDPGFSALEERLIRTMAEAKLRRALLGIEFQKAKRAGKIPASNRFLPQNDSQYAALEKQIAELNQQMTVRFNQLAAELKIPAAAEFRAFRTALERARRAHQKAEE